MDFVLAATVSTGHGAGNLVVAFDVASSPVLTVTPDDDLHSALRKFTQKNIDDIPVVDPQDQQRVIGVLSRKDLIAAYHAKLSTLQARRTPRGLHRSADVNGV